MALTFNKISHSSSGDTLTYTVTGSALSVLQVQWGTSVSAVNANYYTTYTSSYLTVGSHTITISSSTVTSGSWSSSGKYFYYLYGGDSIGAPTDYAYQYCNFAPTATLVQATAVSGSTSTIRVRCNPIDAGTSCTTATYMTLTRSTSASGSYSTVTSEYATSSGGIEQYMDATDLSAGTTYYFKVTAYNSINGLSTVATTSSGVSYISGTTNTETVVPSVTFSSATGNENGIALYFSTTNADGIYIYRSTTTSCPSDPWKTYTGASPYVDTTCTAGVTYYYWVQAYKGSTTSFVSSRKSATRYIKPSVVTQPTATVNGSSVTLTYSVTGANSITIYDQNGTVKGYTANLSSITIDNLDNGTYKFYLYCKNSTYNTVASSYYSNEVTVNVVVTPVWDDEPTHTKSGANAILSYSVRNATYINVYRQLYGTAAKDSVYVGDTTDTSSYKENNVPAGMWRYYLIAFNTDAGTYTMSDYTSYKTYTGSPTVTSFSDIAVSGSTVTLSYTVSGASVVYIYRGTSSGGEELVGMTSDLTSFSETLSAGTYYYYIRAYSEDTSELSEPSTEKSITITDTTPTIEDVFAQGGATIQVGFTAANCTSVNIYRGTSESSLSQIDTITPSNGQNFYTDDSAEVNVLYYYQVQGVNSTSSQSTARLPTSNLPHAIRTSSAEETPVVNSFQVMQSGSSALLTYSVDSKASAVEVYRMESAGTSTRTVVMYPTSLTSYTDDTVVAGTQYYYRIRAVSSSGIYSEYSTYLDFKIDADTLPKITSFTAEQVGDTVVLNFTTENATWIDGYKTYDTGTTIRFSPKMPTTTYTDSGVEKGHSYTYYIVAKDSATGNLASSPSESITVVMKATTDLKILRFEGSPYTDSTHASAILLEWNVVGDNPAYRIERHAGSMSGVYNSYWTSDSTFLDTDVEPGVTYYYQLIAYEAEHTSMREYAPSETTAIAVKAPSVAADQIPSVTSAVITSSTTSGVRLTYAVSNANSVEITKLIWDTQKRTTTTTTNLTSYTDTDVKEGYTYYYRVQAVNTSNNLSSKVYPEDTWLRATITASYPEALNLVAKPTTSTIELTYAFQNATVVRVYRAAKDDPLHVIHEETVTTSTTSGSYTDTDVEAGVTYYYRLYAAKGSTTSAYSWYPGYTKSVECSLLVSKDATRIQGTSQADRGTIEHSITFTTGDENANPTNTWADWAIVPATRPLFLPPTPKYQYIDIPGADSDLDITDFTEILDVGVNYNAREGSNEFIVLNGYGNWASRYSTIMRFLHGRTLKAFLNDDPGYFYKGRFAVNEWRSEKDWSRIVIDYHTDPYKYERFSSVEDWEWDYLNFDTGVIRDYRYLAVNQSMSLMIPGTTKRIIPTFYVSDSSWTWTTNNTAAGTIDKYIEWSEFAVTGYPEGFEHGVWGISNGVPLVSESHPYYKSCVKKSFNGYASMVYTPPSTGGGWICEYDNTGKWVASYGTSGDKGKSITVPLKDDYSYAFTIVGYESTRKTKTMTADEVAGGWMSGSINPNTGAFLAADGYGIRSVGGFAFNGYDKLVAKTPTGYPYAVLFVAEFDENGNYLYSHGSSKSHTTTVYLTESHAYYFYITGQSDSDMLATSFLQQVVLEETGPGEEAEFTGYTLGLSKTVYSNKDEAIYTSSKTTKQSLIIEVLALRCWSGVYGAGENRRSQITALGYDYDTVQNRVNEMKQYFGVNAAASYDYASLNSQLISAGYMTSGQNFLTMTLPASVPAETIEQERPTESIDTSATAAGLTVTIGDETFLLPAGWTTNSNIIIKDQETYLTFSGYGEVSVHYRGAIL